MDDVLVIRMFGEFSISYDRKVITDRINRSKKTWTLLEYLITFRDRDISQNEIIELLWPDDEIDDPANTLKTLLHRVRSSLALLGFPDTKRLITSHGGTYAWNTSIPCDIDTERFEQLLGEAYAAQTAPSDKLQKLLDATEIYKGDFLLKNALDSWIVPISTYYRSRYMKAATDVTDMLIERGDYDRLVEFCQRVVTVDPYEESIHYCIIKGLFETRRHQQALAHYAYVSDLFYGKFGVSLSSELTELYKQMIENSEVIEMDINVIKEKLQEDNGTLGSFYCEFEVFRNIYRLEARSAARTGQVVYICLLTLTDPNGRAIMSAAFNQSVELLREMMQSTLRQGDVFTRYSASQYLVLLPATTYESCKMVMERIRKLYRQQVENNISIVLHYTLQTISPKRKAQ